MRKVGLMIGVVALAGCTKAPDAARAAPTAAEAEAIAVDTERSFTTGNADQIMSHYAKGAVMFDPSVAAASIDRAVQSGWARNFTSMKPADFAVSDRKVQVLDTNVFVVSGIERFSVAAGTARPTVSSRFTDVYQRQSDGSWKIVTEHMSLPPAPTPAG